MRLLWIAAIVFATCGRASGQEARRLILPEQRCIEVRDPSCLRRARIPDGEPPATVSNPGTNQATWELSLDQAIRIALENSEVIRVAAGNTAVATGATIYEPAITNTQIDQARAAFDPVLQSRNTFSKVEQPFGTVIDPGPPTQYGIAAVPVDGFQSSTGVSKQFITGGTASVNVNADYSRTHAGGLPLNPQTGSNVSLGVDQPLLQGAGSGVNLAPILIARINTEQSFFQMKDSVQDLLLSVVQTYWNLSYAQTDVWARRQQVEQGREAFERAQGRLAAGFGDEGEVAQARVSYENFRAALVASEANLLDQEDVLRNLLGLPVSEQRRIVLTTGPMTTQLIPDWRNVLGLAEQYRPDIIELKLVLEADEQQLLIARNQDLPQLNVGALYRWNGLEGTTPEGLRVSNVPGEFADWQVGVNFSVPLGLRRERAAVRQRELLILRDTAALEQAIHAASHNLAGSMRNLARYYEQFQRYRQVREAAQINVERQLASYMAGRPTLYLSVLLAINDWGNSVTSEYQALVQYNTELARLERQTGTILETHGVRFMEERFASVGPLGRLAADRCYPKAMPPGPNADHPHPAGSETYQRPEPIRVPNFDGDEPAAPEKAKTP